MKTFKAKIFSLTYKGLGIARTEEGKLFFIPNTWPGDEGIFEITKEQKSYGEAKILEIIKKGEQRVSPKCQYQDQCGGCPWMIGSYESQLKYKKEVFESLLKRYKVSLPNIEVIPSVNQYHFKSRAQFKIDQDKVGFFKARSHQVVDIEECKVLTPKMNELLKELRNKDRGNLQKISLDEQAPYNFTLNYRAAFTQGHSQQNDYMKNWLEEHINDLSSDFNVLELFAGSGNFTEILIKHFHQITAIDSFEPGIKDLGKRFPQIIVKCLDLYGGKFQLPKGEVLLLDPPRAGLKGLNISQEHLQHIFYISCNPDTYLKDIKPLLENGFEVKDLKIVDAFPHTPHMEIVSYLRRD